jgi:hypothetical protein
MSSVIRAEHNKPRAAPVNKYHYCYGPETTTHTRPPACFRRPDSSCNGTRSPSPRPRPRTPAADRLDPLRSIWRFCSATSRRATSSSHGPPKTSPCASARKTSPTQRFAHAPRRARYTVADARQLEEELARDLQQMKLRLQGTPGMIYMFCAIPRSARADRDKDTEVNPELVFQLLSSILTEDLLYVLAVNIHKLPFESRKDAQVIFSTAFRYKPAGQSDPQVLHHIVQFRPDIIIALCRGYDRRESAMPCGGVLREALKYDAIAALLLYDEGADEGKPLDLANVNPDVPSTGNGIFWRFFDWIDKGAFELSADAFNTFRVWIIRGVLDASSSRVHRRFSQNTNHSSQHFYRPTLKCSSQSTTQC